MGKSHTSVVLLTLPFFGFSKYRCDRDLSMRMNLTNIAKIFKHVNCKDTLMMTAQDNPDTVTFVFESANVLRVLNDIDFPFAL